MPIRSAVLWCVLSNQIAMYCLLVCFKGHMVDHVVVSTINNVVIGCKGIFLQLYILY
jgi:hypothetical protein